MFHQQSPTRHSAKKAALRALIPVLVLLGPGLWFGCLTLAKAPGASEAPTVTYTVCASGCDFGSIQTAIDTVSPGDILSLAGETFTESLNVNKSLTIQGAGAGSTIVQAAGAPGLATSRVVTVQPNVSVTLDSLTIRYGNANGASYDGTGGAILNQGTLTISHSSLYSNTASFYGGAINNDGYARTARLVLISSEVISNTGSDGGGIYNDSYNPMGVAQVIILGSRVSGNSATFDGGGIFNGASSSSQAILTIVDSEISSNEAAQNGGGISNILSGANVTVNITRSVVAGNSAWFYGGGFHNQAISLARLNLNISATSIDDNSAIYGGGMLNSSSTSGRIDLAIHQSTLSNNVAAGISLASGGGIKNESSDSGAVSIKIDASTISSNTATSEGGGIHNGAGSGGTTITNISYSTLAGNAASGAYGAGGGIKNYQATLILWGNIIADSAPDVDCYNSLGTVNDQGYNIVEYDTNCLSAGTSFSADPVLGPLQDNGGATWTQALQAGSPALDALPTGACGAATDQRGVPRPQGSGCDRGAYEALLESWVDDDWHSQVDVDAYDPTLIWGLNAFNTIRQGVEPLLGGTIHVLAGTFTETFTLDKNVRVLGESGAAETIVQAAGAPGIATSRVITVSSGVSVTLEGLTIRHGRALNGGGINNKGTLTLTHTTIVSNSAFLKGGGIYNSGSDQAHLAVIQSTLLDNYSNQDGGGIYNDSSSAAAYLAVRQSTLDGNAANGNGGGLFNDGAAGSALATVDNSTFSGNSAQAGGGLGNSGASAALTITHGTFSNNAADISGSDLGNLNGAVTLFGSILANSAGGNNCASNNTVADGGGNLVEDGSCGFAAGGDPVLGPLQENGGATWTYALLPGSPAIDAVPAATCQAIDDQRGRTRPVGIGCDSGAYELDTFMLEITKSVDDAQVDMGQTITFTIALSNAGPGMDGARIGDALPAGLNFTGPIILDPPDAGSVGFAPPTLVSGLVISANRRLTVTFPVTVSYGLAGGLQIVNTAAVSSTQVMTPLLNSVAITVTNVPPLAEDDDGVGFDTDEDTAFTTANVLDNDEDLNGDGLSVVSLDTTGTIGLVTDNGDGTFDYDPNGQFEALAAGEQAIDIFTYTVSDGHGGTDTATVTITIDGLDEGPEMHQVFLPLVVKNW